MTCPDCGRTPIVGEWPLACRGAGHVLGPFWNGSAETHASEKTVIFRHPQTGEIRTPGRADRPMPEKYAQQGYERVELSARQIPALEKKTGLIHEASNYSKNSAAADRDTGVR